MGISMNLEFNSFDLEAEYSLDGQTLQSIVRVMRTLAAGDNKARDLANILYANLNHAVPIKRD
jgi:hypothetical protein